jgi:DNA-binding transcriptional LysR family regulator
MTAVDPRLVTGFVTLADELHFGRAAERLHLSQPALTQQLQRLERQLGVPLFTRNRHRVELTEVGAALLPAARAAREATESLADIARAFAAGERGELRLGLSTGSHYAAGALLGELPREIGVKVRTEPSAALGRHVADGDLDVALAFCVPEQPGVSREPLLDVRARAAVHRDHALATAPEVSLAALSGERIALSDEREAPGYNRAVIGICEQAGFSPVTSDPRGGAMAWERAIDNGCVGLSSRTALHSRNADVRLIELRETASFTLYLLTADAEPRRPAVGVFCATARRLAGEGRLLEN